MPELPEVETIRRGLAPLEGTVLCDFEVRESRLRWPVHTGAIEGLVGGTLQRLQRRGKYLLLPISRGGGLIIHLGMSGKLLLLEPDEPLAPHDHASFWFEQRGRSVELRYRDPRRFGSISVQDDGEVTSHRLLAAMGPEPLGDDFAVDYAFAATRRSRRPIKNTLMDARFVAGVGNIYASEALWEARVHPRRAAGRISRPRWERLCAAVRKVLQHAVEAGGTTLRDFRGADGDPGYFQIQLSAYGRQDQPCRRCDATIRKIVQAGRATYYCPTCQR